MKPKQPKLPLLSKEAMGWVMCTLAACFYCYEFFLRTSPSVMVGTLMKLYHIHAAEFGVLASFYYYSYTPMQLFVGPLIDMHGVRRMLTMASGLCVLGTYLFIGTPFLFVAELGRLLVGFGSAFAFVGVLKLAAEWLPPRHLALVSGLTTLLGMIGAIMGESLLLGLINSVGWKPSFFIAVLVGLVLTVLIAIIIRDSEPNVEVSFGRSEIKNALRNIKTVIRHREIWIVGIIGGMLFMPISVFAVLWGIPYLQQALNIPPQDAANMVTMIFIGFGLGSPLSAWISNTLNSRKKPLIVGSLTATILLTLLLYLPAIPIPWIYSLLFVFGVLSSVQVLVFPTACEHSPHSLAGTAVSITNMLVMSGGAIIPPIVGKLLDYTWNGALIEGTRVYTKLSYEIALSLLPIGLFIGFLLSLLMKDTYCQQQEKSNPCPYS